MKQCKNKIKKKVSKKEIHPHTASLKSFSTLTGGNLKFAGRGSIYHGKIKVKRQENNNTKENIRIINYLKYKNRFKVGK